MQGFAPDAQLEAHSSHKRGPSRHPGSNPGWGGPALNNSVSNKIDLSGLSVSEINKNPNLRINKKKIKDIKEGDYVLSLDEKTGKLVPRKVNALLDHGVKPIYEMVTESGKAINTTAEHPYLVKLYDKESCDKYAGNVWNKEYKSDNSFVSVSPTSPNGQEVGDTEADNYNNNNKHINADIYDNNKYVIKGYDEIVINEDFQDKDVSNINNNLANNKEKGYCTRWVEVRDLKEGDEIAVPKINDDSLNEQDYPPVSVSFSSSSASSLSSDSLFASSSISSNSLGENTLTLSCFFNLLSPENIPQFNFDASAKYGESLKFNLIASESSSKKVTDEMGLICFLINENISAISSFDKLLWSNNLSILLPNSENKYSGMTNSNILIERLSSKTLNALPLFINAENTTLTSTTSNIYFSFTNFSYLSANAKLTSSASLSACSWVSFDLDNIFLIRANSSNSSLSFLTIANCQFILDTYANSSSSSGISMVNSTMLAKNKENYIKFSNYKNNCGIPKLFHPYLERYFPIILEKEYDKKEALLFLRMVRLKERKLVWTFEQKEKGEKNKDLAFLCEVGIRRFQQLYSQYKMTGKIPNLNWKRRPKTLLKEEDEKLINKALEESKMNGAVYLRLYIKKYYGKNIPHNKIHLYLLKKGIAQEDEKKKKQRVYTL